MVKILDSAPEEEGLEAKTEQFVLDLDPPLYGLDAHQAVLEAAASTFSGASYIHPGSFGVVPQDDGAHNQATLSVTVYSTQD